MFNTWAQPKSQKSPRLAARHPNQQHYNHQNYPHSPNPFRKKRVKKLIVNFSAVFFFFESFCMKKFFFLRFVDGLNFFSLMNESCFY